MRGLCWLMFSLASTKIPSSSPATLLSRCSDSGVLTHGVGYSSPVAGLCISPSPGVPLPTSPACPCERQHNPLAYQPIFPPVLENLHSDTLLGAAHTL